MIAESGIRWLWSAALGATLLLAIPLAGWVAAGEAPTAREALGSLPVVAVASSLASDGLSPDGAVDPVQATAAVQTETAQPATTVSTAEQDEPAAIAPTSAFTRELEAVGLSVSTGGNRILARAAGPGTPQQLLLSQMAADRFGIVHNPYFDPLRVAVVRGGEAIADLGTGVILGHDFGSAMFGTTEVIGADLLEELRARAGWSISVAREAEAARALKTWGFVPAFLQSDEAYTLYKEGARANYLAMASAG